MAGAIPLLVIIIVIVQPLVSFVTCFYPFALCVYPVTIYTLFFATLLTCLILTTWQLLSESRLSGESATYPFVNLEVIYLLYSLL